MRHNRLFTPYSLLIFIAIIIRFACIPNPGFEADVSFWKSWGLATYDKGIVEGMKVTNNNYPTPFAYTLGSMVWIYSLVKDPHNFNEFWSNTNLLFLTISKLFPIVADIGIAGIILYIGKRQKALRFPTLSHTVFGVSLYELLSLLYLFNPLSIIDGAVWGQVDSVGVFIFFLAFVTLLSRKPFWAGALYMLAMMTKLQNMIYGPLFFLFAWQYGGFTFLTQTIMGALTSFLGLNIQFLLTRNADRVLSSLTENYDYFPWMSLNAYNVWWIYTGAAGMTSSDKVSVIGMMNAKTVGLILFATSYLFGAMHQWKDTLYAFFSPKPPSITRKASIEPASLMPFSIRRFLEALIIANSAFFLFQTQSHDRYAFPLSVFLLLWAPFIVTTAKKLQMFILFYTLFTLFYFYNVHTALVVNYPHNGLPLLSLVTAPFATITTAWMLISLFFVFLYTIIRNNRFSQTLLFLSVLLVGIGFFALNLPLFTKKPISLTKLVPFVSEQAYGTRQIDKTVQSSFGGPNTWTRLSVQYAFYEHGIGSHANSKYSFDVHGNFSRFETDYGIDTEAGTKASAIFEIYGDNTLLYQSEKMGRFTLPHHASVDITGVKTLTLITTDAGDSNIDDHTDWLNPQLFP